MCHFKHWPADVGSFHLLAIKFFDFVVFKLMHDFKQLRTTVQ